MPTPENRSAFPDPLSLVPASGISTLDYFAGQVIAGNLEQIIRTSVRSQTISHEEVISKAVFDLAQALVNESERRKSGKK